ncbi:hypothetical protein OFC47_26245, partial [Escherichia coli]|nr:hypothetical protein [Escherichia coli]
GDYQLGGAVEGLVLFVFEIGEVIARWAVLGKGSSVGFACGKATAVMVVGTFVRPRAASASAGGADVFPLALLAKAFGLLIVRVDWAGLWVLGG